MSTNNLTKATPLPPQRTGKSHTAAEQAHVYTYFRRRTLFAALRQPTTDTRRNGSILRRDHCWFCTASRLE